MSLNLAQVFVRYPDVQGCAQALQARLVARLKTHDDLPRHLCVNTGSPWLGVFVWGNSAPPDLAEHLSRMLEAEALWYGLSGHTLAYRIRRYRHGKMSEDQGVPPEIFRGGEDFPMPDYPDAEREVYDRLVSEGIPIPYVFAYAEELGARAEGRPDAAVLVRAPWSESGVELEPFSHRLLSRPPGLRTQFDESDPDHSIVTDLLMIRGRYERKAALRLLQTLRKIAARKTAPPGWSLRFRVESPADPSSAQSLALLHAQENAVKAFPFALEVKGPQAAEGRVTGPPPDTGSTPPGSAR